MKKRFSSLVATIILVLSHVGVVSALPASQKQAIDAGIFYFNTATTELCIGGAFGSGPLYGPQFPQLSDTADLATRISSYISETLPSSPLQAQSEIFVQLGQQYNVNPAMVVAMAQMETSLGTAGYGTPSGGYNITNIRPGGSFAKYSNYRQGIEAAYKNLAGSLYLGPPSSFTTIDQVINRWAPPSDNNDTQGYIKKVGRIMQKVLQDIQVSDGYDSDSSSADDSCGSVTGGSGIANTDGYAFPIAPQKKSENGNVANLSPLPCQQATCHHDGTAAFDLGRQPGGDASAGTPVYAISEGKIDQLHLYKGISGCYSLQFRSAKDNLWYWYGHLQNPLVRNGESVKAGQQIAEVGVRKCTGNGSLPHLHIDRGCIIGGVPQKGGRESCRDADFTGFMNKLFESLPS
ncbi:MAG: M23 family metallopeptidase [Candidatus Saccharimonadales bacterium]